MARASVTWFSYAAPARFYALAGRLVPWFWALAVGLSALGLWIGFGIAPSDFQQGDAYRIIFIHVPAAWMSMVIYAAMALFAVLGWAFNTRMSSMYARALAPTGALFTFLALWTGALWGKPTWGAWWVWDARHDVGADPAVPLHRLHGAYRRSDRRTRAAPTNAGAVLALVGVVNVPVIYFSVQWWNTLHQGSSTISMRQRADDGDAPCCIGMLIMTLALWAYSHRRHAVQSAARAIVLERERGTRIGYNGLLRQAGATP